MKYKTYTDPKLVMKTKKDGSQHYMGFFNDGKEYGMKQGQIKAKKEELIYLKGFIRDLECDTLLTLELELNKRLKQIEKEIEKLGN